MSEKRYMENSAYVKRKADKQILIAAVGFGMLAVVLFLFEILNVRDNQLILIIIHLFPILLCGGISAKLMTVLEDRKAAAPGEGGNMTLIANGPSGEVEVSSVAKSFIDGAATAIRRAVPGRRKCSLWPYRHNGENLALDWSDDENNTFSLTFCVVGVT